MFDTLKINGNVAHSIAPSLLPHQFDPSSDISEELESYDFLITNYHLSNPSKESTTVNEFPLILSRPDIPKIFDHMKKLAKKEGETRVAVCVCGPKNLVDACKSASIVYSGSGFTFDIHSEKFDF